MKTIVTVLFTGAMLVSTATAGDAGAEARFRMKYGRSTPAVEAQARILQNEATACMHGCCLDHASKATLPPPAVANDGGAAERFRAQWGRNLPSQEPRLIAMAATPALPTDNGAAARFVLKFGRSLPEDRLKTAPVLSAAAHPACACDLPCCKEAD